MTYFCVQWKECKTFTDQSYICVLVDMVMHTRIHRVFALILGVFISVIKVPHHITNL